MMWFLLLVLVYPHLVESQEENRMVLADGSNPCEGYIKVYHDKKWGYLGAGNLSTANKKVVCHSIQCGEPKSDAYRLRPDNVTMWLHELKCEGEEKNLWECEFSQWSASEYRGQTVQKITCSNTLKVALDESHCKGQVYYSTDGHKKAGYICGDTFSQTEGQILCQSLGCGDLKELINWANTNQREDMIFTNCLGLETHLWQCAPKNKSCGKPANVICEGHKVLQLKGNSSNVCSGKIEEKQAGSWKSISEHNVTTLKKWCSHMYCGSYVDHTRNGTSTQLTCSDTVRVVLKDNNKPSRCYGTVYVEVNGTSSPVCGTSWTSTSENSDMVCRELGCGKVLTTSTKRAPNFRSLMDSVSCGKGDFSLWHCKGKHSQQPFSCNEQVYITCSDSVDVILKDGPGKCAGRLEIFYEGQWQKPRKAGWTDDNSKTICRHLNCGDLESSTETYTSGPRNFWNKKIECSSGVENVYECKFSDNNNPNSREEEVVSITCQGYKDIFLTDGFCSGRVGIQSSGRIHWLSGERDFWTQASADAVCQEIRCGTAESYDDIQQDSADISVWKIHDCPSNLKSVFDCRNNVTSPNVTSTGPIQIASVNCTGSKTINLTYSCWGHVNVCEDGQCGGVCGEVWTDAKAKMLCQRLECGDHSLPVRKKNRNYQLAFKSVHLLHEKNSLTKSHLVRLNESDDSCKGDAAYVVCTGSYKPKFDQQKDYCSGNVHLYQENQWLPVCNDVDENSRNIMCNHLNCSSALHTIDYHGARQNNEYVSNLKCQADSSDFKSCSAASNARCTPIGLQCSDWMQIVLVLGEDACSGVVFVYSKDSQEAVSAVGWTDRESQRLCEDLDCGKSGVSEVKEHMLTDVSFWKGSFNCTSVENPENIWDCRESKPKPSEENRELYIKCSDRPSVTLTKTCHGEVKINSLEVCDTQWDPSYSNLVCQEKGCSDAIPGDFNTLLPESKNKLYQHVSCQKYHNQLGQCRRFMAPCTGKLVTVKCRGNIQYRTSDFCGGKIEVSFDNQTWNKVCSKDKDKDPIPFNIRENFCKGISCAPLQAASKRNKDQADQPEEDLNVTLTCTKDHQNIKHCLSKEACSGKPVQVICGGYIDRNNLINNTSTPVIPIVLGLGLVFILTVAVLLFLRYYLSRKNKTIKDLLPMFSKHKQKGDDFESGEYEDIPSKERDDVDNHGLDVFSSEANAMTANNASSSSLVYDDVEEITEDQPLTSTDPGHVEDDYEVEDPQDNYDDIDAGPEVVETAADVHPRPSSPQEDQEEAPDLVLEDDDYLVPGEDA